MTRQVVGAVTIGQTPRPDLLEPLIERIGTAADILETGALDGLAPDRIGPRAQPGRVGTGAYPLTTRLRDGSPVTMDEAELAPLVQQAIDRAEDAGAEVTVLLCAGGFLEATARRALVRPFDAAVRRARELGARRVAIVVPYEGQRSAAEAKWRAAGFEVRATVADLASVRVPPGDDLDAIVLDYVGHAGAQVRALRARASVPVIDLGEAGADAAVLALAGTPARGNAPAPVG